MLDPADILGLIPEIVRAIVDMLRDPEQRMGLAKAFMYGALAGTPTVLASLGFTRYAKNRGRDISGAHELTKLPDPFTEPRLNDAIALIRRYGILAISVGVVCAGIAGYMIGGNAGNWLVFAVVWNFMSFRGMFVEACLALGAEPAKAPEPSLDQAVDA